MAAPRWHGASRAAPGLEEQRAPLLPPCPFEAHCFQEIEGCEREQEVGEPSSPQQGSTAQGGGRPPVSQGFSAYYNLVNTILGTGTISLPKVVVVMGAGLGGATLALMALLTIASQAILIKAARKTGSKSYHDVMERRYGRWGADAASLAHIINSVGKMVAFLVIGADVLLGSPPDYGGLVPELLGSRACLRCWYMQRWAWVLVVALLAVPLLTLKDMNKIARASALGDVSVALLVGLSAALAIAAAREGRAHPLPWGPGKDRLGIQSDALLVLQVLSMLSLVISALISQTELFPTMEQLEPFHEPTMNAAASGATLTCTALYLALGLACTAVFGGGVKGDVLLSFTQDAIGEVLHPRAALWVAQVAKASFLVNTLVSFPLYMSPCQKNMWELLRPGQDMMQNNRRYFATNYVMLAGMTAAALVLPDVMTPLKFAGSTAGALMAYIFPGMLLIRWERQHGKADGKGIALRAVGWALVLAGVVQGVAGMASLFVGQE